MDRLDTILLSLTQNKKISYFTPSDCLRTHKENRTVDLSVWMATGNSPLKDRLYSVARIPNFPYMTHHGYSTIFIGLTLECIASNPTLQIYLGCIGVGNLMRKVEQSDRGTTDSSLEGDWMPVGRLILNTLMCAVDEKRHVFSGQQLLALWR